MSKNENTAVKEFENNNLLPVLCNRETVFAFGGIAILLGLLFEVLRVPLQDFDMLRFILYIFNIASTLALTGIVLCGIRNWVSQFHNGVIALIAFIITIGAAAIVNLFFFGSLHKEEGESIVLYIIRAAIISGILGAIVLRYLHLQQSIRIHREKELEGRIKMLQAKIRPHFLFNSLNSISSLVMFDSEKAERAIDDLADLFRSTLKEDMHSTIQSELKVVESFVRMEELRLGDRLKMEWDVDISLMNHPIIHLSIQPLVENAILHGIHKLPKGGTIKVTIKREGLYISVTVTNPVPNQEDAGVGQVNKKEGNRMALQNIRSRLEVLFSHEAELITEQKDGYYMARFYYPFTPMMIRGASE